MNDKFPIDNIWVGDTSEYLNAGYEMWGVSDDQIQGVVKMCWLLHHLLKAEVLEVSVKLGASRHRLHSSVANPSLES